VGKMTSVAQVLDASGLGRNDRLSASAARLFLEGVSGDDTSSLNQREIVAQLEELQERMQSQGGPQPPWRWAREAGILHEITAKQAGEAVANMYWATPKGAGGKRGHKRGRPAAEDDEPSEGEGGVNEDDTSSSGSDEEGDVAPQTAAAGRRRAPLEEDSESEVEAQVMPRNRPMGTSAFATIVPAGMDQLEAARIFFDNKKVQEAAACEEVPAAIPDGYHEAMVMRYTKAFDRLCDKVGRDWLPSTKVLSAIELHLLREDVIHIILSGQANGETGNEEQQGGRGDEKLKPDKGLDLAQAAEAVPAVVASRLHGAATQLAALWGQHRENLERTLPAIQDAKLRTDLARALVSNGKVDAEGETLINRKSLPPIVHVMRRSLIEVVKKTLEAVPAADESGEQYLAPGTALALAGDAVKGKLVWAVWLKASKEMMGKAVAKGGSFDEMLDAFRLMGAAWALVVELVFDSRREPGIEKIKSYLGSAARAQVARLSEGDAAEHANQLTRWLQRVLGSWEAAVRTFRSSSRLPTQEDPAPDFPSVSKCVDDNGNRYQFQASVVALLARMPQATAREGVRGGPGPAQQRREGKGTTLQGKARGKQQRRSSREVGAEEEERSTKKRKEEAARANVETKTEGDAVTLKFSPAKWREMARKWPDVCRFYLKGDCNRESCKFKHEKPAEFEEWCQTCDA
jgi:hypothetical protein